jgi:hypothetical protein
MILKLKKFWSCLLLVVCTLGLVTPVQTRAQGDDISLATVATVGGGAAALAGLAGMVYMGYLWGWLIKMRGEAKTAETSPKSTNLTFDEWCSKTEGFRTTAEMNARTEDENCTTIRGALAEPRTFSAKYRGAKLEDVVEELNKEIEYIESCMSACETCCFAFKGFSLYNRIPGLKVDWRYNNFINICNDTGHLSTSPVTSQEVLGRPSAQWTVGDYRLMNNAILGEKDRTGAVITPGYIDTQISSMNSISKAAVEVWWMYFKKLFRLKAIEKILSRKCGASSLADKAREKELLNQQKTTIANNAHYNFIGPASSNLNPAPPAPPPAPPVVASQQSWKAWLMGKIINKWTVGIGAAGVAIAGLVKYGQTLFTSEPDLSAYL